MACLASAIASFICPIASMAAEAGGEKSKAATNNQDMNSMRVYVVPMRGQVGTDIVPRIYEEVVEDIKEQKPDIVIFELESSDERNVFDDSYQDIFEGEMFDQRQEQSSLAAISEMADLRIMFDDEIPSDVRQVLWVHDAVGVSAALGMSWCDFYMTPDAGIGKMGAAVMRARGAAGDANVEAKFGQASYQDLVRIISYGDCDPRNPTRDKLINAMAMPELSLSVFMNGREYLMGNHEKYDTVLDDNDEQESRLSARICDDFCISDGTADSIEDLMVLLGERQFVLVEGKASEIVNEHHEGWRAAFARAKEKWKQYQKWLGRAQGRNFRSSIGKAEKALKSVRALVVKYPEVARRTGLSRDRIDILLLEIEEMKRSGRGRPGGGGGGGGPRGPAGS
ncbi:MAG: hypothetical protein CMJ40_10045 [Phycisphaerae bacterium]|nr:hypothetical protein [Phycisphaerae bacterium]|tara:strand:+ start:1290 stop:2477 length:1188 start_codon:yes stop_codon:yes gene_type:complete